MQRNKNGDDYPHSQDKPEIKTDAVTIKRISLMHPKLRDVTMKTYLQMCEALTGRAMVRFTHTLRTFAEQDALYSLGRDKMFDGSRRLGIVTNAKAGQSPHNYGLAFDIVLLVDNGISWDVAKDFDGDGIPDWMECVKIAKDNGWFWGGDFKGKFKDRPHFENTLGHSIKELYTMHLNKEYKAGYLAL